MLNFEMFENYYGNERIIVSNSKRAMFEILTGICILNPEFLTKILDGGYKHRYTLDNKSFLTEIKNIIAHNNTKFKIGKFDNECDCWIMDEESSKIHSIFHDDVEFDIEKNWSDLIKADKLAKKILESYTDIKRVYWTGLDLNITNDINLVIEDNNSDQFNIAIKNIFNTTVTKNADKVLTDLFSKEVTFDTYTTEFDIMTNKWLMLMYEYLNIDCQKLILEWLDTNDIDDIDSELYLKLTHPGEFTQKLGKYVEIFDKNIKALKDLMKLMYDKRHELMDNVIEFDQKWNDIKNINLNSRIFEHIFITNLKELDNSGLYYNVDGDRYRSTTGEFKTYLIDFLFNKMLNTGKNEIYYYSDNGKNKTYIPSNIALTDNEDIIVLYKYHNCLESYDVFKLDIFVGKQKEGVIKKIMIGHFEFDWFGEMKGNLKCKIKFDYNIDEEMI